MNSEIKDIDSVTVTTISQISQVNSSTDGNSATIISDKETTDGNSWVYGTIVGAVVSTTLAIVLFVMCLSVVCYKCQSHQKRGKPWCEYILLL